MFKKRLQEQPVSRMFARHSVNIISDYMHTTFIATVHLQLSQYRQEKVNLIVLCATWCLTEAVFCYSNFDFKPIITELCYTAEFPATWSDGT